MATLKLILDYENNKNIIDKNYKSDEEGIIKIRDLCVFLANFNKIVRFFA